MAVTILLSLATHAQHAEGRWSLQPKVGINPATMTNADEAKLRTAFVAGAELEYQASRQVSVSFGTLYSQQGCDADFYGIDGTIKMDYINIPVMVNVYVADGLALKTGLQPGFLINDKVKVSTNGVSAEVGLEESYRYAGTNADIKTLCLSLPIGISYEFSNIQIDARYNLGLTKAISVPNDSTKHSVFEFTVGYKFSL